MSLFPFFVLSLFVLCLGTLLGLRLQKQRARQNEEANSLKTIEGAVLALLGLLLGFTFSMSVSRYDQRRQLEVEEANAIGTTWLRTTLLLEPARSAEQTLLRQYVPARQGFFAAGTSRVEVDRSLARSGVLQAQMWKVASEAAQAERDPVTALFLASLNEAIDAAEKRTAAFENRIPVSAWIMLLFVGFSGSVLVGVGLQTRSRLLLLVLPVVVATALVEIRDLDSPRSGFIHVDQHSMERLAEEISAGPPLDPPAR